MQDETTTTTTDLSIISNLSTMSRGALKRTARAEFDMVLIHTSTGNEFLADLHRQRVNAILAELSTRKS